MSEEEELRKGLREMFKILSEMDKGIKKLTEKYKGKLEPTEKNLKIVEEEIEASNLPDDLKQLIYTLLPIMLSEEPPRGYIA